MDNQAEVLVIELTCMTSPFKKQKWQLQLSSEWVRLLDESGAKLLTKVPSQAVPLLTVPGLTSSSSLLGIVVSGAELEFKIAKQDRKALRQYVDTAEVTQGSVQLKAKRKTALVQLVIGVLCLAACIAFLVIVLGTEEKGFGRLIVWIGIGGVLSLIVVIQAIAGLFRVRRLLKMLEEAS